MQGNRIGTDAEKAGAGEQRRTSAHLSVALVQRLRIIGWRLKARLKASLNQSATYSRANMRLVGFVAVFGHPLYYVIWTELAPGQFESLGLRLFSSLLAVPLLFERQILATQPGRRFLMPYWFFIMLYELPFLFVFMSLMNGFSTIWSLSTMAALMLLVLLVFDWLMIFILAFIGSLAAWLCFLLVDGHYVAQGPPLTALLPTYLFALIAGSVFNYKTELVAQEKLAAMTDAIGTIAHELRTPLLGIGSGARGLEKYLPVLIEGFELARSHGLAVRPIRTAHFRELQAVLDRIGAETRYSSVVLDMLLTNSSRTEIDNSRFEAVAMSVCVRNALERYPFQNEAQARRVVWDDSRDFVFRGSELMMVHVLFNLLKNALHFIDGVEDGYIRLWVESGRDGWYGFHFMDTGPGISPEVLPRIFDRFYSGLPRGQGTGIGLAFVRLVINSFGGEIHCQSTPGQFTEFVMMFPPMVDHEKQ